jgi:ribosomal protein S3
MSINYKRMADLIGQEVRKLPDISDAQQERLEKLANKIYTMESTCQAISAQKMADDIASEISLASDLWKGK